MRKTNQDNCHCMERERERVKYISCRLQKNVLPYKWLLPRGCPLCGFDELVDRSELLLLAICSCNIYVYDTSTYVVGDIWAVALLRLFQKDCYNNITTTNGVKIINENFLKKESKKGDKSWKKPILAAIICTWLYKWQHLTTM